MPVLTAGQRRYAENQAALRRVYLLLRDVTTRLSVIPLAAIAEPWKQTAIGASVDIETVSAEIFTLIGIPDAVVVPRENTPGNFNKESKQ